MTALPPWAETAYGTAIAAWRAARLGHAQLICGPAALGKRALAEALAARLLCQAAEGDQACGQCRSCRLLAAGTHPDLRRVGLEENPTTGKLRSEIVVEQVRGVGDMLSMTVQLGGAQVVLFDPADALNHAAANALLKTLEEPAAGRFLLLVSAAPNRLPATIRSRCQRISVRLPEAAVATRWLAEQGLPAAAAAEALALADGHPGLAAQWLRDEALGLRDAVRRDLQQLAAGRGEALAVALQWAGDGGRLALRLRFAAELARDLLLAGTGAAQGIGLTPPRELDKLGPWFDDVNRVREQLAAPLRHDLLLVGLLNRWQSLHARTGERG
jgi:DNA polymerase-3 subunit delta'